VRTTLTLDDDVAARLKAEARRSGKPFKHVLNDCLRRGLLSARRTGERPPFQVVTRDLGALRPGLSLDNIAELLEIAEGPLSR
jgi:hypothetical protein